MLTEPCVAHFRFQNGEENFAGRYCKKYVYILLWGLWGLIHKIRHNGS